MVPSTEPSRDWTGLTKTKEAAAGLTDVAPFVEKDMLAANGGDYSKGADWASHVIVDGKLITEQNPASFKDVAEASLKLLS